MRKHLIDLDFRHKELHIAYKRENQDNIKAGQEETERRLKQEI